jgi:transcriptional regulator GlxA family with amidase domain
MKEENLNVAFLLFENFETLDVFGVAEIFGKLENAKIKYYSMKGGQISNNDGIHISTENLEMIRLAGTDVFIIPGGAGTRKEISNSQLIELISEISEKSRYVLTVCTGSALLAKTALLDGRNATTNKRAFDWVANQNSKVKWQPNVRWIADGKFYSSAGVSAGIDMALGFVSDLYGQNISINIAERIEYQ